MDNELLTAAEMRKIFESDHQEEIQSNEEIEELLFSDDAVLAHVKNIIQEAIKKSKNKKQNLLYGIESTDPRLETQKRWEAIFNDDPRYLNLTYKVADKLRELGYTCEEYGADPPNGQMANEIVVSW
jgi:hypothetical protein